MKSFMLWLLALLIFPTLSLASVEVLEPVVTVKEFRVISSGQLQDTGTDEVVDFGGAGTFSGIAKHFYGNARQSTVKTLLSANGRRFDRKKYAGNDKSYWLYVGSTVKIASPMILELNNAGNNPTCIPLRAAVEISLPALGDFLKTQSLAVSLPSIDQIVDALIASQTIVNLKGELVHTATFGKGVQGVTKINVDMFAKAADFPLIEGYALRVTYAEKACRNVQMQILVIPPPETPIEPGIPPVELEPPSEAAPTPEPPAQPSVVAEPNLGVPAPAMPRAQKVRYILLEEEPELEKVVKIFVISIENTINPLQAEVVTEYRLSTPWSGGPAYCESVGANASFYTDKNGDWWYGPAGMFDSWWGEVDQFKYWGGEVVPGVAVKYEKALWNVRSHIYVGDIRESGSNESGYETDKKYNNVVFWDLLGSSKNVKYFIPFLEEVNLAIWGRWGNGDVDVDSTWQGNPISGEEIRNKRSVGARIDLDIQSIDLTDDGQTLTFGTGYRYDSNEWDHGSGPFVTAAYGQRQVNEGNGEYNYQIPPHKYVKLYAGLDVERETYEFLATIFWAEGYYAYKDRELRELFKVLRSGKAGDDNGVIDQLFRKTLNEKVDDGKGVIDQLIQKSLQEVQS